MKKMLLFTGIAMLMAAAVVTGFATYSKSNASDLLSANIEALAQGEMVKSNGPGDKVYCAMCMTYHVCCYGRNDKLCIQTCH